MNTQKHVCCLSFFLLACIFCENAMSTDFSIDAVFFNEKKPSLKDDIGMSLAERGDSLTVLKNDVAAINSLKNGYSIKIVGSTDNKECSNSECEKLSLRRAQMIYRWMLANGVPQDRLLPPEGRGANDPVASNAEPDGRARNRYVEFQVIPDTPPQ